MELDHDDSTSQAGTDKGSAAGGERAMSDRWEQWSRAASALALSADGEKQDLDAKMRLACPELFDGELAEPALRPTPASGSKVAAPPPSARSLYPYGPSNISVSFTSRGSPEGRCPLEDCHPEERSKGPLRAFVAWMAPLIKVAREGQIQAVDIWPNPRAMCVKKNADRLKRSWRKELHMISSPRNQFRPSRSEHFLRKVTRVLAPGLVPSFGWALLRSYRREIRVAGLFHLGFAVAQLLLPFMIGKLLNYLEDGEGGLFFGMGMALVLGVVSITSSYCIVNTLYWMRRLGLNMRTAVMMNIYEHALLLTPTSRQRAPAGRVINLMSVDADKLFLSAHYFHALWHGPLAIIAVLILLTFEIGAISAVCGVSVLVAMLPVQHKLAHSIKAYRTKMSQRTDVRVKLTNEILQVIRAIKYYAWEKSMVDRVEQARNVEISAIYHYLLACGFLREAVYYSVMICAFTIFAINILVLGRNLGVVKVFRVVAYLNTIRYPVNLLGQALKFMTDVFVSVERLDAFFRLPVMEDEGGSRGTGFAQNSSADGNFSDAGAVKPRQGASPSHTKETTSCLRSMPKPLCGGAATSEHVGTEFVDTGRVVLDAVSFSWDFGDLVSAGAETSLNIGTKAAVAGDTAIESTGGYSNVEIELAEHPTASGASSRVFQISGLSLTTNPGELIAVIGPIGAGKSSLLAAIMGQMNRTAGACIVEGNIAFCQQDPWIQCMSMRENILFGSDYDEDDTDNSINPHNIAYQHAVHGAGLERDIKILPHGDLTEIGERGANVSGGQKARIALARAILAAKQSDIFLLDDPFAAVDGSTGEHMFMHGVVEALKGKLRIVVMNSHMELLKHFDKILMLDSGTVIAYDTPENLLNSKDLCDVFLSMTGLVVEEDTSDILDDVRAEAIDEEDQNISGIGRGLSNRNVSSKRLRSLRSVLSAGSVKGKKGNGAEGYATHDLDFARKTEGRATGDLSSAVYIKYFGSCLWNNEDLTIGPIEEARQGVEINVTPWMKMTLVDQFKGSIVILVAFLIFFAAQTMRVLCDLNLIEWAQTSSGDNRNWGMFYIYLVTLGLLMFLNLLRMGYLNTIVTTGSNHIHRRILRCVLAASVPTFFDMHAIGEVLNRFSKDMEVCDTSIPEFLMQFMINWIQVISIFGICIWTSPLFLAFLLPLGYAFVSVYLSFACVSRDLKRLEGIYRSPVFASFSETLDGVDTIRAFGHSPRFVDCHLLRMDFYQKISFHLLMSMLWVSARLEMLASLVIFAIAIVGVSLRGSISTVAIGLAMVYALQLTALFQKCVQISIDLQAFFTSVERVLEYTSIPQEVSRWSADSPTDNSLGSTHATVPATWPSAGSIEFRDVWLRYREGLEPVLKGLLVNIQGGTRVGICGRTGAGKSSIMVALFRVVEVFRGAILMDGVDVRSVALAKLRTSLAIIPQDPVLFSGTLRFQLDPFSIYNDMEIWEVLDHVFMGECVRQMDGGLDAIIEESGSNISQGQRQLLCIARAALRKCKILIMDEATAAVDPHTDDCIQQVLRGSLLDRDTTVLTIAHRLNTIVDYDKILVLANGGVGEFGSPKKLLRKKTSLFYKMYHCV